MTDVRLNPYPGKRNQNNASIGFQKWASKRRAERRRDAQRYAELGAMVTVGELLPTCRVCGGRSPTWAGHDSCTGVGMGSTSRPWRRAIG